MEKIIIEINYSDQKDIKMHLSIIRDQVRNYFKQKEKQVEEIQKDFFTDLHFSSHSVTFKD